MASQGQTPTGSLGIVGKSRPSSAGGRFIRLGWKQNGAISGWDLRGKSQPLTPPFPSGGIPTWEPKDRGRALVNALPEGVWQ